MDPVAIERGVVSVLKDMVQDWDADAEIGSATRIVADLQFESIDVIQLVVAIEEHFGRRNLGFDRLLMVDGRYVDDLSVAQVVAFLATKLTSAGAAGA